MTRPNILKEFNPDLHGYSTGVQRTSGFRTRSQRKRDRRRKKYRAKLDYNFAETGADSDDVIKQAYRLVRRMQHDPRVDFYNDWKFVTVLVGHNDVCSHACQRTALFDKLKDATPHAYVFNVRKALDILHERMPRTFVNLMASAGAVYIV